MLNLLKEQIPIELPVAIIAVLFLVFLLVPLISKRIHVPSIILIIISGIIIGPHGLNILSIDNSLKLLADVGIVFIMFLAGIELDINQIKISKKHSIVFGILAFAIPFVIGFGIFNIFFNTSVVSSILIALMFSTQTLVSMPTVSKLGLNNNRSAVTAVGGTIITDAIVLFAISILITSINGALNTQYLFKFISLVLLFVFLVVFVFPIIARQFFKHSEESYYAYFTLIMALLFLAGTIAHFTGLEAIIGAFLAGIVLNKYIPKNSALMSNLHFTGNAIFIPIFLFYVGMLINYKSVIGSSETLIISIVLTLSAIISKYFAAWIAGKSFKFSKNETGLLFGLSVSHAVIVIATALIGYNLGIISISFLNASVILILFSCLVSSYLVEHHGKNIVITEKSFIIHSEDMYERVLVPYANPEMIERLLDIAVAIIYPNHQSVIHPLTIVMENDSTYKNTISINQKKIEKMAAQFYSKDINFRPVSRIDVNFISGINRAVKELMASILIIGWTGKYKRNYVIGKNMETMLENTDLQIMICNIEQSFVLFEEIIIFVPDNSQFEKGFRKWMVSIDSISKNIAAKVTFVCKLGMDDVLKKHSAYWKINQYADYLVVNNVSEAIIFLHKINNDKSLIFFISARDKSVSEDEDVFSFIAELNNSKNKDNNINKSWNSKSHNFIMIVPERYSAIELSNSLENEFADILF